jgi:probable phosphoglycerate mutase
MASSGFLLDINWTKELAVYFARHGQTNWNLINRWQSRTDIPLNHTGRQQARALSQLIRSREIIFKRVLCSPLRRARETAEILMDGSDPAPEVDSRLVELDLGDFEGCLESELGKELGKKYDRWKSRMYLDPAPKGEGILDVVRRIEPVLTVLRETPGHVLVVGHQGVNMALKAKLSNCFTVDCLSSFRQRNDEIDFWEITPPSSVMRISNRD